jgi:MFS family permease
MTDPRAETGVFHGWKLVWALSVILFFAAGGSMYVFPVFIESFQEEFGWSMTQISVGAAFFAIVMGLSNPVVGTLFARWGARATMLTGATLLALASIAYASLLSLWMLYATMMVAGFAVASSTVLPAQTLVTHWFDRFRGRAMGVTMLGIGAGGLLLPPLNEFLIRLLGWRLTWLVSCAILVVIVIPLIATFVRTRPSDLGLSRDGTGSGEAGGAESAPTRGLTTKAALATLTFWLLVGIFLLQLTGVAALNFHFVPFAIQEIGFTSQQAAVFYGLAVGFSIVGRLLFGWLADRWPPTLLMAISLLLAALGPAVLELFFLRLRLHEVNLLWLYAVPFGIGSGGNFVTLPVLVGRCLGELHFSKIMGLLMTGSALGIVVGIPVSGWIFDETGSYEWVLIGCLLALLLSTLLTTLVRPERYHGEFVTEGSAAFRKPFDQERSE